MANVRGRKALAVVVLGCLCAASIALPAYAQYHVQGEASAASDSKGVIEVTYTVDETAAGEGVRTGLLIVPEGSTAAVCQDETLSGTEWTCTVYHADAQKPGTHTTHDASGTEGESTPLERFDNVVFTVA